jgi:DegV family protein with EDD domain
MGNVSNKKLYNAILAGASEVMKHRLHLNKINVFPVPDGDTGSNLFSMMNTIIRQSKFDDSIKESMDSVADAAIIGARGNSGIIFAQYFNGLSKGIEGSELTVDQFIAVNDVAYKYAYSSISNPVEGTMITVMGAFAKALKNVSQKSNDFINVIEHGYLEVEKAVIETTNQLKVLKQQSVVDSGAKGFMYFVKGFLDFLKGDVDTFERDEIYDFDPTFDTSSHSVEDLKYRYCTEAMFIDNELNAKEVEQQLNEFGDSLIVAVNERVNRIHVHTDRPDLVFDKISTFSTIVDQKIDDMIMQNEIVNHRLSNIAIVTDSVADLSQSLIDQYQIHVVNLSILINETTFIDKLTINNEMVEKYMNKGSEHPTTSQPGIKTVENLYNYLLSYYDKVVVLTLSKELSGTFNVFDKVSKDLNLTDKVTVLNTKQNSGAQGLLVQKCAEDITAGKSFDEVIKLTEERIKKSKIIVKIKTLKNMISSGRLSTKAGKIANLVNLRPLITLDSDGKGGIEKVAFSDKSASNALLKRIKKIHKEKRIISYNIVHVSNLDEALSLNETLTNMLGFEATDLCETSSIIAVGAGKGAVAVSFITE